MNYYNFGIDIARKFYPLSNDTAIELPTQNPAIYVFSSLPNLNDARDGDGAIEIITSWTQNASSPFDCSYTISAIDEPSPESLTSQYIYYIAINYVLQTGEQTQTVLESFVLERASGTETQQGITYFDLVDIYNSVTSYATNAQLSAHIDTATGDLKDKLLCRGIRLSDIQDLSVTKKFIVFRAIQYLSESQIAQDGDKFVIRREIYKEKSAEALKDVLLYVDTNRDGLPDTIAQGRAGYVISTR